MERLKKSIFRLPEFLLLISVFFYWYSTSFLLNPIAILLTIGLAYQILSENQITGIVISGVLIAACLFMLLALMSELSEFPTFNDSARHMLMVGLTLFLSTIAVSILMMYKYLKIR